MSNKIIHCTRPEGRPHILLVTIDRPPVNAMTLAGYRELLEVFQSIEKQSDIRCVIITGGGDKAFVAGADVSELGALDPLSAVDRARMVRKTWEAMRSTPVPVIAAINGHALGAGLVMLTEADIVVASERATFGLPEIDVGVLGGVRHLGQMIPQKIVRWMAFTGTRVKADFLAELGVIQKIVPAAEVIHHALDIADQICEKSPAAIRLMKEVMNLTERMDLPSGYHVEGYATALISAHPNSKEAALAFKEKRKARF